MRKYTGASVCRNKRALNACVNIAHVSKMSVHNETHFERGQRSLQGAFYRCATVRSDHLVGG